MQGKRRFEDEQEIEEFQHKKMKSDVDLNERQVLLGPNTPEREYDSEDKDLVIPRTPITDNVMDLSIIDHSDEEFDGNDTEPEDSKTFENEDSHEAPSTPDRSKRISNYTYLMQCKDCGFPMMELTAKRLCGDYVCRSRQHE